MKKLLSIVLMILLLTITISTFSERMSPVEFAETQLSSLYRGMMFSDVTETSRNLYRDFCIPDDSSFTYNELSNHMSGDLYFYLPIDELMYTEVFTLLLYEMNLKILSVERVVNLTGYVDTTVSFNVYIPMSGNYSPEIFMCSKYTTLDGKVVWTLDESDTGLYGIGGNT